MSTNIALRLANVTKTFPGVVALYGASLDVLEGEVHALVGENGAGKSTLMGVAAGSIVPDEGTVEIGGRLLERPSPAAAQEMGLAVVYQHLSILDDLTVAENMVFAMPAGRRPAMADAARWTRDRIGAVGATIDPAARISELGPAERQLLEIAKALALDARVLILDEPTESLTAAECEQLFERIARIRADGAAVVYISHRLPEVRRVADRITVLRDGKTRGTATAADLTEADVLRLVAGRSIDRVFPAKRPADAPAGPPVLEIHDLSGRRFAHVSLTVAPGEIVGLAGVEGNGQRDVLRALAGLAPITAGEVLVAGSPVSPTDPWHANRGGIVHLPGERHREGVFLPLSVRENVALPVLGRLTTGGLIGHDREVAIVRPQVERLDVRTVSLEAAVETLSGGNQQKVLLARALLAEPKVLLADEPTRGVDVGSRVELYQILRDTASAERAVVIVSSDALELQGLCDRVLVFSRGTVVQTLEGDAITEAAITGAAITASGGLRRQTPEAARRLRIQRFLAGDYAPSAVLAILVVALAIAASLANGRFLSDRNLTGMLLLAAATMLVSLGQLIVIMSGGFDLSVGPLTGLAVIVMSYLAVPGAAGAPVVWILAVLAIGALCGLANGWLVERIRLSPVIATLATFIVLQGISLFLRSKPGGLIDRGVVAALKTTLGPIPLAFIVVVLIGLAAELVLRRTRAGLELRAVGSDAVRAYRLGARVRATKIGAYVACSLFAVLGGLMLASQVGIGDASLGTGYSLTSITAVVLGGASIFGGRGAFVGALLGGLLLQEIITSTSFLGLGVAWTDWLPGILILVGAGVYSRARGYRSTIGTEISEESAP
ncbi:MAG TPA: ATP-binding cassette domain-containing protein [Candidatus Limnocylindrales bacterium]